MPYSITTKDGITIRNIPDDIPPDSDALKQRVAAIRAQVADQKPAEAKPAEAPGVLDRVAGVGEAALTALTGLTAPVGMAVGTLGGLGEAIAAGTYGTQAGAEQVQRRAQQGAGAYVYQPRTETGRAILQGVADLAQPLQALGPPGAMGLQQINAATMPARATAQLVREQTLPAVAQAVRNPVQTARTAAAGAGQAVREAVGMAQEAPKPTPGTMASGGAAATDIARLRAENAASLDAPIPLTKGQATRQFDQQQFERETAKDARVGEPLRQRMSDQNQLIWKNFDLWSEQTGAEAPSLRAVGVAVDRAVRSKAAAAKTKVRALYKKADAAGESAERVSISPLLNVLGDPEAEASAQLSPIIGATRKYAADLAALEGDDGAMSVKNLEKLYQFVNANRGDKGPDLVWAGRIKDAINATQDQAGGRLYQEARTARRQYAQEFERIGIVDKLLTTKKNSDDRRIALEDVFSATVLNGSTDDLRQVRRLLQTSGPQGVQGYKELRGAALNWIREQAGGLGKSISSDTTGVTPVSAAGLNKAIRTLDNEGKLEILFGNRGAEKLRVVNEVAKDLFTAPPGSVNTSNTASIINRMLADSAISGVATGVPLPLAYGAKEAVGYIKNRKLRAQVQEALNWKPEQ